MELTLIRSSGMQLFPIAWVELTTQQGSFVVQRDHAPMIVTLAPESVIAFMLKSGKHESVPVKQAIAEIMREKVVVLVTE